MSLHSVCVQNRRGGRGGGGKSVATPGKRCTRLSVLFMVEGMVPVPMNLWHGLLHQFLLARGDHLELGQ